MQTNRKPIYWLSSALKDMRALPDDVQDIFGQALLDAQCGDTPAGARRFGEGVRPEVWKLAIVHNGDSYRAAYTAHFPDAIYFPYESECSPDLGWLKLTTETGLDESQRDTRRAA